MNKENAKARFQAGERASLIPAFEELVAASPESPDLLRSLAICYDDSGAAARAEQLYKEILRLDPGDLISSRRLRRAAVRREMVPSTPKKVPLRTTRTPVERRRALPPHEVAKSDFARVFEKKFRDLEYYRGERNYKWEAHELWNELLSARRFSALLAKRAYAEACDRIMAAYTRPELNLLSRFETMALNGLRKGKESSKALAESVYDLVYGKDHAAALDTAVTRLEQLNVRGTRPTKWPILTVFPYLAQPTEHIFLKPQVTKRAAERFGFELGYKSTPSSVTYGRLLDFAAQLKLDLAAWKPRDNIDIQSFIWVTNDPVYRHKYGLH